MRESCGLRRVRVARQTAGEAIQATSRSGCARAARNRAHSSAQHAILQRGRGTQARARHAHLAEEKFLPIVARLCCIESKEGKSGNGHARVHHITRRSACGAVGTLAPCQSEGTRGVAANRCCAPHRRTHAGCFPPGPRHRRRPAGPVNNAMDSTTFCIPWRTQGPTSTWICACD